MENPTVKRSLYLKYRPKNFEALIGQDHIKSILKEAAREDKISQGYLLVGPRGTGKTTTARLIAKTLNCEAPKNGLPCDKCDTCEAIQLGRFLDVIEIDAASNTGVDDMRDLIEKAKYAPNIGKKKIYIIDEVHMLSKPAFNALLKTLEEPPSHVHFILATTEVNKIPPTIISRCQRHDFKRIIPTEIVKRLKFICNEENFKAEDEALGVIAKYSDGGMRDAISLLEQVVMQNEVTTFNVESALGIVRGKVIEEFINLILEKKTSLALTLIDKIYQEGVNLVQFKKESLEYLRQKILSSINEEGSRDKISRYLKLIESLSIADVENASIPQFPMELFVCKETLSEEAKIITTENEKKQPEKPKEKSPEKMMTNNVKAEEPIEYKFTSEDLPENKFTVKPTLEKIREDWRKIIDKITNSIMKMSFREAFLEKYADDILYLSFNSEFHFNKVKTIDAKNTVEEALENYFKVPVKTVILLSKIEIKKEDTEKENELIDVKKVEDLFNS